MSNMRTFKTFLGYLDYANLMKLMQTRRAYRWDLKSDGNGYQPDSVWVHKALRKRMKEILLYQGGIRSSKDRLNFWIYRTKMHSLRRSNGAGFYRRLVSFQSKKVVANC